MSDGKRGGLMAATMIFTIGCLVAVFTDSADAPYKAVACATVLTIATVIIAFLADDDE